MNKNRDYPIPEIVNGRKARFIRLRLLKFIFIQIFKSSRNPFFSFRQVKRLMKLRRAVHGNQRITKFVKSGQKYHWVTDYPGFPSTNLKLQMKLEFLRNHKQTENSIFSNIPQQTIIWGITNRCPLKCKHCYDWDNIDTKDHCSLEQLKFVLARIEQQGIRHVQLSGGEPLSRFDDMISILREASYRIDFWLLTSGFGLTPEKAEVLKKAGLIGVNISLDNWKESAHNDFRNNSESYNWAIKAIENCRESGILVSLSLCATREFVTEENLELYAKLAKNSGVHFIRILEPRQVGQFSNQQVHLTGDKIEILSRFAIKLNTHSKYKDFPIVTFFGYHQRKLGCMGAGDRYLYIDANGDFHACPFCRGKKGNILTDTFNDAILKLRESGCEVYKTVMN